MDDKPQDTKQNIGQIEITPIVDEMQTSYLAYAMSVIVSRALPDIRDGLKPVQRRIIYAMHQMGYHHSGRFQKCASVTGETMKNYHPHGDIPIYDSLVRMGQDFSMRYMLIDPQGNFGCFTKDTKIKLTDGRDLDFEELIDEAKKGIRNYTYSVNKLGLINIAEIKNPRLTIKKAEIIKITLDNGEVIKCTPNHLFMLKDGTYKEAQLLTSNNSLMPLYQKISEKSDRLNGEGYLLINQPKTHRWVPAHQLADNYNLTLHKYTKSRGRVKHHINFNKNNNNPDNITRLSWKKHWQIHYQHASKQHQDPIYRQSIAEGRKNYWSNPENRKKHSQLLSKRNIEDWQNSDYREKIRQFLSQVNKDYIQKHPEKRIEFSQRAHKMLIKLWQDPKFKALMHEQILKGNKNHTTKLTGKVKFLKICKEVVKQFISLEKSNYSIIRNQLYPSGAAPHWVTGLSKYFGNDVNLVRLELNGNHRISNIETLKEREDVYDLTIDGNHNFALAAGVFVHNSIDGDPPAANRYCLTGETLVVTNKGLQQIQDLSPGGKENISIKILSKDRTINNASKWFDSGKHPTIKIKTRRGYNLQGSHNHPLIVWAKNPLKGQPEFQWKLISQVQLGDIVVIDRSPDLLWPTKAVSLEKFKPKIIGRREIKSLPKTLNKSLGFILGSLISEGSITLNKIEFCNSDEAWINDFEKQWKSVFPDCRVHKFLRQPSSYGKKPYFQLEIHSRYVIEFLKNLGLEPVKSAKKTIPQLILQSPKAVAASFIRAYFEGDGTIGNDAKSVRLGVISISKTIIEQFQVLLLRFGLSSIQYFDKYRGTYNLNITGVKNYQIFSQEIGFLYERKKLRLENVINTFQKDSSILDYVPFLRDYIYENLDKTLNYDRVRSFVYKHNFDRYTAMQKNYQNVLPSIISTLKLPIQHLFEKLISNNYIFDPITSIEDSGIQTVYSIRVDSKCHSFVANGFLNHNTECRLAALSEELLRDINKDTVDFVDNYSGSTQEPVLLPSVIPNLLLNGASGIAVGMATQIPPHNLGELTDALIYMIDKAVLPSKKEIENKKDDVILAPVDDVSEEQTMSEFGQMETKESKEGFHSDVNVEDLMKFIKGPDFPTGASIYDQSEFLAAYATGKGRIVMRAKADIEETKSGRFDIIVTELPYQVNKSVLIAKIADLVKDKKIDGIADLRDESDRRGLRIMIELKRDAKPQSVLNNLFKHTSMQSVFNVNMVALSDGVPHLMTLKRILEEFIHHRQVVVRRRTEFELREARARAHILEGLKIAVDNIDEVISIIRKSADADAARTRLMDKFGLTAIQATAILDMQLRRLAALERQRIEDELKEVMKQITYLEDLLAHAEKILKVVKEELIQIREKYADERKTRVYKSKVGEFSEEDLVADETTIVTVTKGGYVKRQPPMSFRTQNRGGKGVSGITTKDEDAVSHIFYTKTLDNLLFFTDRGRVFQIKVWEIPEVSRTAKGQAIVNLINVEQGEKITAILTSRKEDNVKFLFMCTREGNVKKTSIEEYANIRKNGLISIKLDAGDELCWVVPTKGTDSMIVVSRKGQSIRFHEKQVRPTHRDTSGVRGIMLKGDTVVSMNLATDPKAELLVVMENGMGKKTRMEMWKVQGRGGSGIKAADVTDKTGEIVTAKIVDKDDDTLVLTSNKGQLIKLDLKDVPTLQRQTQGVRLMRMKEDERVAAATVVSSKDKAPDSKNPDEAAIVKSSEPELTEALE